MASSVVEGYEQVSDFENIEDSEYEEEEEVCYVTLDMGPLDPTLLPNATSYQLIGLETSRPFLQVGGCIFRGQYEHLLGTEIIFQEPVGSENVNGKIVPVTTTESRIRFHEVQLVPKEKAGTELEDEGADLNGNEQAETASPTRRRPRTTLGGVSREATTAFLPATRKGVLEGLLKAPKANRRFWKRPDGYETPEEERNKKRKGKKSGKGKEVAVEVEEEEEATTGENNSEEAERSDNEDNDEVMREDSVI